MKPGDKFPVNLDQWTVAEAVVIDIEDGQVTLDIPATRIVMGVKTSLTELTPSTPEKDYVILDDRKPTGEISNVPAQPTPNTSGESSPTQVLEQAPVEQKKLAHDDIGEGLASVVLPEMD